VDDALVGRFPSPRVTFQSGEVHHVSAEYVRFDTVRLHDALRRRALGRGVHLLRARFGGWKGPRTAHTVELREPGGPTTIVRARAVVDCRGRVERGPKGESKPLAFQSAFGAWLDVDQLPLAADEMSLMDWRPAPGAEDDGLGAPSFLYAMPDRDGLLFAQETILASRRPAAMPALEHRLARRLAALGIVVRRQVAAERCLIPLGTAMPYSHPRSIAFGAAAGLVQPASGYSLSTSLGRAPLLAASIAEGLASGGETLVDATWNALWPEDARRAWSLHRLGLCTMLGLRAHDLDSFWRAFFQLEPETVARFLDGRLSSRELGRAMWGVFQHLPLRQRLAFAGEGLRFAFQTRTGGLS
jgi:lycopene beta-cyclase